MSTSDTSTFSSDSTQEPTPDFWNVTGTTSNITESLEDLNSRYAGALLPLTVIFGIMAVVGVAGNILVILVFALIRDYKYNNFKIFVLCLAIIDLVTSGTLIPAEMIKHIGYFSFGNLAACKAKCFFNIFAGTSAAMTLLIICIDRYRKVCRPLKTQIQPRLALRLCVGLAVFFALFLSWPSAVMCGIDTAAKTNIHGTITEVYVCAADKRYKYSKLRIIYRMVCGIILLGVSVTCILIYCLIGRQIIRHRGSGRRGSRSESIKSESSDAIESFKKRSLKRNGQDPKGNGAPEAKPLHRMNSNEGSEDQKKKVALARSLSNGSNSSSKHFSSLKRGLDSPSPVSPRRTFSRQTSKAFQGRFPYKTIIWFVLTLIFIVTYMVYTSLSFIVSKSINFATGQLALFLFFFRLYFINNIVNPIVYALLDKRFRASCRKLLPTIKKRISECCT